MEKLKTDYSNGKPWLAGYFNKTNERVNQLIDAIESGSGGDTTEILSKIEEVRTLTVEETRKLQEGKQDKLVSGTNIKTINSITVLGSGNIDTTPTSLTDDDIVSIFNN